MAESVSKASELLALWGRLSSLHVTLGGGCSCGVAGVSVSLEDFERDIADYLQAEAQRLRELKVYAFVYRSLAPGASGTSGAKIRPVRDILERLVTLPSDDAVAIWLLSRMTRTLESFVKLHGPAGTAINS